jgi:hypothetical protein
LKIPHSFWNILGGLIFAAGFLLGMVFICLTVWSDLEGNAFWGISEAANFDRQAQLDAQLKGLSCPPLLTRQETGTAVAGLVNPLDQPVDVIVKTDFSRPGATIEPLQDLQQFQLSPHERRNLSWTVGMENLKFNRLILVRTYLIEPALRIPVRTAHCGILVVDTDKLNSNQIILSSVLTSLIGMIFGIILWVIGKLPLKNRLSTYSMLALAGLTLAGIITTLTGFWIVAGGFVILNLIILLTLFENIIQRP